jgi:hypothetical protein
MKKQPKQPKQPIAVKRTDIVVEGDSSIAILRGMTDAGYVWIEEHCSAEGYQPFGLGARLVEPRYLADIVNGATADGLVVRRG